MGGGLVRPKLRPVHLQQQDKQGTTTSGTEGTLQDPLVQQGQRQLRFSSLADGPKDPLTQPGTGVLALPSPHSVSPPSTGSAPPQEAVKSDPVKEASPFEVEEGQVTFDAEGTEGGRYPTRTAHWPGGASGVTIGRGYDLGSRSRKEVLGHMMEAGIPEATAKRYAKGAGLKGKPAARFVRNAQLPEITPAQQKALFQIVYGELESDVMRISGNYAKTLGRAKNNPDDFQVDWETLDPRLRDLAIDLRFRGDYTPATRRRFQPLLIANDVDGMRKLMSDRKFWKNVPDDRFQRRIDFLNDELSNLFEPGMLPNETRFA